MEPEVAPAAAAPEAAPDPHEFAFRHIVCGIDGSRSAHEAARQASALIAPGGTLDLVAIADEWGAGLNAGATLSKQHARRSLDAIRRELRGCDAHLETRMLSGRPPWQILLNEAANSDLLVVARHSHSRIGGIAIGRTATEVIHHAHLPLLIAVAPPKDVPFPERILVAADGPGHPERAVRLAGMIARDTGAEITLVRLNWSHRRQRPELAAAIAELSMLGVEPVEILMSGLPRRQIPALASRERMSLIVLGSRGLLGARAFGSTSERIAHESPCSVLVLRPPATGA